MAETERQWAPMRTAPRDGTRILVAIRASEQGPAEVDVVRWAKPAHGVEPCFVAVDSDPAAPFVYNEGELASWMPLPNPLPRLRGSSRTVKPPPAGYSGESDGSSI